MLTPDKQRVKELLCETITLLCKNGLHFQSEFCIDGLIGITLDQQDVFLVNIRETVKHGEVFVRDRRCYVKNSQVTDEMVQLGNKNRMSTNSEASFDFDGTSMAYDVGSEQTENSDVAVHTPQPLTESAGGLTRADEENVMKTEVAVTEDETEMDSERHKSSCMMVNNSQTDCRKEGLQTTSAGDFDRENDCIQEASMILPEDGGTDLNNGDEIRHSRSVNAQMSQVSLTADLKYSSPEARENNMYNGNDERTVEKHTAEHLDLGRSDFKWNSGEKVDGEESDGEELVVVKVEPPSTDYSEEPLSRSSTYYKGQPICGRGFVSDGFNLCGEINDTVGHSFQNSYSSLSSHKADISGHTVGYDQFSQSLSAGKYQMKIGMNQVSMSENYAEVQNFCMNRKARSTFTAYQLQRLENAFKCTHYIDAATRCKLAEELNLTDTIILVWFQNRRQKFKKQMKMSSA